MTIPPLARRKLTRRAWLAGLASTAVLASGAADASSAPGAEWAELELRDEGDRAFRLGDMEGPRTLIQLWANWCPICTGELPRLAAASSALQAQGTQILLVSSPAGWAQDAPFARLHVPGLRHARPSPRNPPEAIRSALFDADGWYYVPRSLLFDRRAGSIVWNHLGQLDWHAMAWRAHLGRYADV